MTPLQYFLRALTLGLMTEPSANPLDPLPTELEQVIDEARADTGRGPAPRTPEQGVADMQDRIQYHAGQMAKIDALPYTRERNETYTHHQRQLEEAQARLTEYQAQLKGRN